MRMNTRVSSYMHAGQRQTQQNAHPPRAVLHYVTLHRIIFARPHAATRAWGDDLRPLHLRANVPCCPSPVSRGHATDATEASRRSAKGVHVVVGLRTVCYDRGRKQDQLDKWPKLNI